MKPFKSFKANKHLYKYLCKAENLQAMFYKEGIQLTEVKEMLKTSGGEGIPDRAEIEAFQGQQVFDYKP